MHKIEIRKAKREEAPFVVNIFHRARANMEYLPVVHTPQEDMKFFTTLVKDTSIWIAILEKDIAGFVEIRDEWLNHLYVLPEFQNQGIGKQLLDIAKEVSPSGISLWVFEENKEAIKFYEREGFVLQEKRSIEQTTNEERLPDRKYSWSLIPA